jgi:hypothetical protein
MTPHRPLADRFHEKYAINPLTGCWDWTAYRLNEGYGYIGVSGYKNEVAHRVSWRLHNGGIPEGMIVCHTCDNRSCVNPGHLFLGTYVENMADMKRKGRARALTADQVKEIILLLESGLSQVAAGKRYGVAHSTIQAALKRATSGDYGGDITCVNVQKYVKLTDEQREEIKVRVKTDEPIITIAKAYNVDRKTIRNIRDRMI